MIDMTKLLGGWDIYGKGGATQNWLSDLAPSSGEQKTAIPPDYGGPTLPETGRDYVSSGGGDTYGQSASTSSSGAIRPSSYYYRYNDTGMPMVKYMRQIGVIPNNLSDQEAINQGYITAKDLWYTGSGTEAPDYGDLGSYGDYATNPEYSSIGGYSGNSFLAQNPGYFTGGGGSDGGDYAGVTDTPGLDNIWPGEDWGYYGNPIKTDPGTGSYADLGVQYPYEWGTASDVLQNFAGHGYPTEQPSAWKWNESDLNQIIGQLGMPTSYAPAYQASKKVAETDISDAIKQSMETMGMAGLRYSTPAIRSGQDIAGRRMAELGSQWTTQELGAQETAMGRLMDALQQRQTLGGAQVGLTEAAKGRAMTAAQALPGLGSLYAQLPQQLATTAAGLGETMQGLSQSDLTAQQQESLRLMAENSPWLSMVLGLSTTPGTAQQYTPGCLSQGLTGLLG